MARRKSGVARRIGGFFVRAIFTMLLIGVLCACFCGLAFAYYVNAYIIPNVDIDMESMFLGLNSTVWAIDPETGEEVLYETLQSLENREWVDLEQIPENLQNAFIAIEDKRFYQHKGVDWKRTFSASAQWATGQATYGGSTITQQLIKNVTSDADFSVKRKMNEIFRALELEKDMTKDQILERYLNTIFLGRRAYGVETAAQTYFGKTVSDLSLAECAVIAGITNNPSIYDPYSHPDDVKKRQGFILNEMLDQELITQAEYDSAVAEELVYRSEDLYINDINEPYSYFTDAVYEDVLQALIAEKGYSEDAAKRVLLYGGLKIYATIDTKIQAIMDEEYNDDSNFPNITRDGMQPESAMVITDKQGNIKGIVGGRGVKEGKLTGSFATKTRRQPGSSIKPIAVYGPAMDAGIIVPTSSVYDKALKEVNGQPWPRNDSGKTSNSPIVIKNAIARSVNTIAVQVMDMLTPQASYDFLTQRLGVELVSYRENADGTTQSDIDYAPLALGGLTDGVTVREMAGAYSTFINEGVFAQTRTYTKVVDSNGEIVLENTPGTSLGFENVRTAYYMLECMQAVTSYGTATVATIPGVETAGKTGTTSANYDRWFCGVTPEYSAAVWFGFEQSYTLSGVSGNPATNMWTTVMRRVHENDSGLVFDSHPEDFENVQYCMDSGLLPSAACRNAGRVATGRFWKGQTPTEVCSHQGFESYSFGSTGITVKNDDDEDEEGTQTEENTDTQNSAGLDVTQDPEGGTTNNADAQVPSGGGEDESDTQQNTSPPSSDTPSNSGGDSPPAEDDPEG